MKLKSFATAAAVAALSIVSAAANAATLDFSTGAGWTVKYYNPGVIAPAASNTAGDFGTGSSLLSLFNASSTSAAHVFTTGLNAPNPYWAAPSGTELWIGSELPAGAPSTATPATYAARGYYLFEKEYDLGADTITNPLSFAFSFFSDNQVLNISLNGYSLAFTQTQQPEYTYETTSSGVISAYNQPPNSGVVVPTNKIKLSVIVENISSNAGTNYGENNNPVGLLGVGSLTAGAGPVVPLPAAVWGGLGLMSLVAVRRYQSAR